ncbi:choice-of-anchor B family protein [Balneola sp. MJW-20]|uniref:choice-of-anchor B family protein n=1 Tax=Gracilimonas aurantiaca TaxID=3234185 RepID=UPI003466560E
MFTIFLIPLFLLGCEPSELDVNIVEGDPDQVDPAVDCTMNDIQYPCQNVELLSILSPQELRGTFLNDIWGWTDPLNGKEYALVGLTDGITFVDISDPETPVVIGKLRESNIRSKFKAMPVSDYPACNLGIGTTEYAKSITQGSTWRDHKVYQDHLFIVSDAQPHGMQVFDLSRLRQYNGAFLNFTEDVLYDRFSNAHNIIINEQSGYAYAAGVTQADICGSRDLSGLHIIDIRDPKSPVYAGCYADAATDAQSSPNIAPGYIHDAQCILYDGPDPDHQGKEICFNSAEGNIVIADVTDKSDAKTISFNTTVDMQYSHQGWVTEDRRYFLMNDEVDELNLGRRTRTYVWDVSDLDNPVFAGYYQQPTNSIDHNLYIRGDFVYQTNYTSGLQIYELRDLANADMQRVAFFDTKPNSNEQDFDGTWSNYPFFDSGVVILSDISGGLFVVRPQLNN